MGAGRDLAALVRAQPAHQCAQARANGCRSRQTVRRESPRPSTDASIQGNIAFADPSRLTAMSRNSRPAVFPPAAHLQGEVGGAARVAKRCDRHGPIRAACGQQETITGVRFKALKCRAASRLPSELCRRDRASRGSLGPLPSRRFTERDLSRLRNDAACRHACVNGLQMLAAANCPPPASVCGHLVEQAFDSGACAFQIGDRRLGCSRRPLAAISYFRSPSQPSLTADTAFDVTTIVRS